MPERLDFYAKQLVRLVDHFFFPLKPSHYLELVTPLWNYNQLQARVESVKQETADTTTLWLRPGKGYRQHIPGQHLRIGISISGKRHVRTYSISSAPNREDGLVSITVKHVEGGVVSHFLNQKIKPGYYFSIGQPEGQFVLPDPMPKKLLFITAGSGITPIMSMLRSMAAAKKSTSIVHIHYAKTRSDVIFGDELQTIEATLENYVLFVFLTREQRKLNLADGKFSQAQLTGLCPDWRERTTYACGPRPLLDEIDHLWSQIGTGPLHVERFQAKKASIPQDSQGGEVRFTASHFEAKADGVTPILRVAEKAGLNPSHGCRMGICHSCDATLKSGTVRDLRTGDLITCEDGRKIQICVTAAASDVEIEL